MIKEIRKIDKRSKAMYIRALQYKKLIKKIINDRGFVCYDTDELKEYQKVNHRGRPPKAVEE